MPIYPVSPVARRHIRKADLLRDLEGVFQAVEGRIPPDSPGAGDVGKSFGVIAPGVYGLMVASGGGVTVLANLVALGTETPTNGRLAYVQTNRGLYLGDGTAWARVPYDNSYYQNLSATWFVDTVGGSDDNDGSFGSRVKTVAEVFARINFPTTVPRSLTVMNVDGYVQQLPYLFNDPVYGSLSFSSGEGSNASGWASAAFGYQTESSGFWSLATGYRTKAIGSQACAEGYGSIADVGCHAEGYYTDTTGGVVAHAEGYQTFAGALACHSEGIATSSAANYCHSEGDSGIATGVGCHVEGRYGTGSGDSCHVEGQGCSAVDTACHAEGLNTTCGNGTDAAFGAHSEGWGTQAFGIASHSEGYFCSSSLVGSHAEGYETNAVADGAHSQGYQTLASGAYSHAGGVRGHSPRTGQFANSSHGDFAGQVQTSQMTLMALSINGATVNATTFSNSEFDLEPGKSYNITLTATAVNTADASISATFNHIIHAYRAGGGAVLDEDHVVHDRNVPGYSLVVSANVNDLRFACAGLAGTTVRFAVGLIFTEASTA